MTKPRARTQISRAFALAIVCALGFEGCDAPGGGNSSGPTDRAPPSSIRYSSNPLNLTVDVAVAETPSMSGSPTQFSISPSSLPAGLSFSDSTGAITGTPTAITAASTYNVTVSNSFGTDFVSIKIAVVDVAPTISYSGSTTLSYHVGDAITEIDPTLGGGSTVSCTASPALPAGLTLSSSCALSGTPTIPLAATPFTITAINSGGSAGLGLNLTVIDNPPSISFAGGTQTFTNGVAITALAPTNAGGTVVSCATSPALPAGLALSNTCSITGAPSTLSAATAYSITATNSGGTSTGSVTIAVVDVVPAITYAGSPFSLTKGHAATGGSVTNTGGAIDSCTVSPALPAGLSISNTTCAITGTPTAITASASYTISAGNTAGTATATITLTVNDVVPTLAYPGTPYHFSDHTAVPTVNPVVGGGTITSCTANPSLPMGLGLSSTCVITGTPAAGQGAANYAITAANTGGSATATISILVAEIAPVFSYTGSPFTYNMDVTIPVLTPTSGSGGPITSCASSPVLPGGLSLSAQCVISGAPTAIAATANYMITATNAGGASTATISITVNATPPVISYPGTPFTFYRTIPIVPANATNSGGAPVSCTSSPTLPAGLAISSGCVITGTPTAVTAAADYTITATNTGGSNTGIANITVQDSPPVISYVGSPFAFTVGSAITPVPVTNTGGATTSCSVSPALPAGLSLDPVACTITGTPTAVAALAGYVVTAGNASGTSTTAVTLTVNDAAPTLSYSPTLFSFMKSVAITNITPTLGGGAVVSCASSPTLPAGLSINTATCVISGTPNAVSSGTSYTVTATNTGGSAAFAIAIGVVDAVPIISYTGSPFTFQNGTIISSLSPVSTGGVIVSCASSPALPSGLSLSTACVITGTPGVVAASTVYSITATNSGGSASTPITISVNDVAPTLSYAGSPFTYAVLTPVAQNPTTSGGAITGCSSSPTLPAGLSLSTGCLISGTPTTPTATANYTVTGTNTGGSSNAVISITVNNVAPAITYPGSPVTFQKGTAITTLSPANTGGAITSCSISPALPGGLSFSTTNCAITGNPNVVAAAASYTVTATNSAGSSPVSLSITVNDIAPTLTYAGSPYSYPINVAISSATPANTGGTITACGSSPTLPAGLAISATCFISGTPTTVTPAASYTITATNSGGSATTTIVVSVNSATPNLNYTATGYSFTYTVGTAIASLSPGNTGGALTSCSISPTLPGGLSFNTSTCAITGTPGSVSSSAAYVVTASNVSGSSSQTLTLTVNAAIPVISYSGSPFTFTKGTAITAQTPTNTGGTIVSCSSSPTLPAGLSLSNACVMAGTATVIASSAVYTVTATNTGGSATASIAITVNDVAPAVTYAGSPFTYTRNTAIATLTPTNTGGTVTGCTSSPALPAGLSLSATCVLTGTPTTPVAAANYTITATNTGGSSAPVINIKVNDITPVIAYTGSPFSFQKAVAITALTVNSTGGNITTCTVAPALPAGLSIATPSCTISGTPTAVTAAANYTISATNSIGTGTAVINITVNNTAPAIAYAGSPFAYTTNIAITTLTPANTGGAPTTCASAPTLPTGLSIAAATCAISGTPTAITAAGNYTITATNAGGTSAATISIAVNAAAPAINYSPTTYNFVYTLSTAIAANTPNNTGGAIVSCSISPTLPTGLSFSTTTCSITGTPTALSASTNYLVTATNTGGSSAQTIAITVDSTAPAIAYAGSPFSYTISAAIAALTATNTGGTVVSCAVSPGLPNGLVLSNICGISGTPTAITAAANYTVTATNSGGSSSATINIAVNDHAPTLSYAGSPFTYTKGTAIATLTPTDTGGAITGCTSAPTLPAGLALSTACVLSGTPTAVAAATAYTITATNSGGTANATINVTVKDIAPAFTFTGSPFTYTLGTAIATLTPNSTGGAIVSCASAPALPAGLSLSTGCVVSGTPTALAAAANHVLTATNTGGTANATINITVNAAAPSIGYSPTTLSYVVRTAISTATATNTGGAIVSCASAPALPAGLAIAATTCNITGTPTTPTVAANYTITATNTGGSSAATLNITIADQMQILFYGLTSLTAGTWNGTAPSSNNLWHVSEDATVFTAITSNAPAARGSVNPSSNPAGTGLAYGSIQKEGATTSLSYNIFTETPAGGSLTFLTANTGTAGYDSSNNTFASDANGEAPVFSPDGSKIAFSSKQKVNGTTSNSYNIWVMTTSGTNMVALTQNTTAGLDSKNPVWDPTSTYIYFSSLQGTGTTSSAWNLAASVSSNIWSVTYSGTSLTALTADGTVGINSYDPVVSPSGSNILYYSTEKISGSTPSSYNIWQRTGTGGSPTALTENTGAGLDSKYPSYSPNGSSIVFSSKMQVSGTTPLSYNIWSMTSNGDNQTALTTNTATALDSYEPSFSPDNNFIAFFSHMKIGGSTANSYNIWRMTSSGTAQTNMTANTSAGLDSYLVPGGRGAWYQPPP